MGAHGLGRRRYPMTARALRAKTRRIPAVWAAFDSP